MEANELRVQPYTEIIMANAMVDCEVQDYQNMIKCKTDENAKYESTIAEYKSKIESLEKSIQKAHEYEEKVKNNIDLLRNSRLVSEGLVMSMKHELHTSQEKREETKRSRGQIIEKYSKIFKLYREEYKSLPWIQKTSELKNNVEIGRIMLNIKKAEFSSTKKKLSLFNKINAQRARIAITSLAKLIVQKNNLRKEICKIDDETKKLEKRLTDLKEEKIKIKEQIDKKVSAAIAKARERAVIAQTDVGIEKLILPTAVASVPAKESIFARLGIGGPLTLKRLTHLSEVPVPQKLARAPDVQETIHENQWKPREDVARHKTKKNDEYSDGATASDEHSRSAKHDNLHGIGGPLTLKRLTHLSEVPVPQKLARAPDVQETIHENQWKPREDMERHSKTKRNDEYSDGATASDEHSRSAKHDSLHDSGVMKEFLKHPAVITQKPIDKKNSTEKNKIASVVQQQPSKENMPTVQASAVSNIVEGNAHNHLDNRPSLLSSEDDIAQDDTERKKKKLQKKPRSSPVKEVEEKTGNKIVKKVTFLDKNMDAACDKEMSSTPPAIENVPAVDKVDVADKKKPVTTEKPKANSPVPEMDLGKCNTPDDAGNLGDVSMDTDSVISLNFTNDNANELNNIFSRTLESPDFLIQRPPGFCFSPPLGQTSTPEKPGNDKQFVTGFMGDTSSSFFSTDKSTKPGGQTSSFFDFFGSSSSPKKSDNSSKSFFNLF